MTKTSDEHNDPDIQRVDKHVDQIAEHFDSVQILVTRLESDGSTTRIARGSGDFFARYGHAQIWVRHIEDTDAGSADDEEGDDA